MMKIGGGGRFQCLYDNLISGLNCSARLIPTREHLLACRRNSFFHFPRHACQANAPFFSPSSYRISLYTGTQARQENSSASRHSGRTRRLSRTNPPPPTFRNVLETRRIRRLRSRRSTLCQSTLYRLRRYRTSRVSLLSRHAAIVHGRYLLCVQCL